MYFFGEYKLNSLSEQLSYQNEHIKVEPQQFNLLLLLVSNCGDIVTRQQVQDAVWAGRPVSDEAIRVAIKKLRDIFNDDAKAPRFVKTLPRQGYRWLAPVEIEENADSTKQGHRFPHRALLLSVVLLLLVGASFYAVWPQLFSKTLSTKSPKITVAM